MPVIQTYPDYKAKNLLTDPSGLIAAWLLDDPLGQSYSRVINPGANASSYIVPRNIVINGTFDTDTIWTKGTGWTITGGQAVATTSAAGQAITQSIPMTIGNAYVITYTITVTAGSIKSQVGTASGATQTASGTYTDTLICTGNTTLSFTDVTIFSGTLDNVTVTQVNIPAYNSVPTQLLSDGAMEAAGTSAWTVGNSATLSKQTGTPHSGTQVLRVARNGVSSPYASQTIFTIGNVERAFGYVRSDGSATPTVSNGATVLFTGTTSTTWQAYDVVFVAIATDLRLGTSTNTGTQYVEYDDCTGALNTSIRRDQVLQDNDMEQSGTGYWVALNGATLSKDTVKFHSGTQSLKIVSSGASNQEAKQSILVTGKTYRVTGWCSSDGTAIPQIVNDSVTLFTGTNSTNWQFFDVIFVAPLTNIYLKLQNTAPNTNFANFDDLFVYEIDSLSGIPTNGVVLGAITGANGHLNTCYSFDGSNDVVNIYSTDLNSMFNPSEGTILFWAKVSSNGVWSDGSTRRLIQIQADVSNLISITRSATNNTIGFFYIAGGVSIQPTSTKLAQNTGFFQIGLTWSVSANQLKMIVNGIQVGNIQTGLGTWVGNLSSTTVEIGGINGAGNFWSGFINDVRLYNRAISLAEIYNLYKGAWPFYMNK